MINFEFKFIRKKTKMKRTEYFFFFFGLKKKTNKKNNKKQIKNNKYKLSKPFLPLPQLRKWPAFPPFVYHSSSLLLLLLLLFLFLLLLFLLPPKATCLAQGKVTLEGKEVVGGGDNDQGARICVKERIEGCCASVLAGYVRPLI